MYDVFIVDSTLALEVVAWTNDTTRATALVLQNGVLVKSGATTRRYLGSFRTTAVSGQTEDSEAKRYVWNAYNRVRRSLKVVDATNSWTYTTATWRQANGATTNIVGIVRGLDEDVVSASVQGSISNATGLGAGGGAAVGVGIDSNTVNSAQLCGVGSTAGGFTTLPLTAAYTALPGIGYHDYRWIEISAASGTTTWFGDNGLTYVQAGMVVTSWQ